MHSKHLARLRPLLIGLFCLFIPISQANFDLPDIGDPSGNLMTPDQEIKLGKAFMRHISKTQRVITDPLVTEYIQSLGQNLLGHSQASGRGFHFFLINDNAINAFAGPGGYIGINTGLFLTTQSESELASVVAHEIAHVTQNHLFRAFSNASDMSIPIAAVLLGAILIGAATSNGDVVAAAAAGVQAGVIQSQINFTRSNEQEADRVGLQILADAKLDPRAMPVFFERMGKANRLYDNGSLPDFLRTHPVSTERIADTRGRAETYAYRQVASSLNYHLLKASLKANSFAQPNAAIRHFQSTLKDGRYRNIDGEHYGYIVALIRARKYAKAMKVLKKLLVKYPTHIPFLTTQANILKKTNKPKAAINLLDDALSLYPSNHSLTIYYSEALLANKQAKKALKVLQKHKRFHPDNIAVYQLLAQAAGDSGKPNLGHEYLAEYKYLSGDTKGAISHLESALLNRHLEFHREARMTARLNIFKEELAALKKH